eukprot:CAMPEP_0184292722 /NCGR_PEP_ID=MMETSP1049-20130417/4433_1 /TAXON_ID=77928 /ORGANISM="Proteomonas sulcata, Strain CCMP704" /LENGTH=56 /DNA_ID=CAMNT_0026600595 /DNA_START=187 /DNA_END=357 /DNA_ORIENTATION=-
MTKDHGKQTGTRPRMERRDQATVHRSSKAEAEAAQQLRRAEELGAGTQELGQELRS